MRTAVALIASRTRAALLLAFAALVFSVALAAGSRRAAASEAARAVAEADAALAMAHPRVDAPRPAAESAAAASDDPDAVAEALLRLGQMDEDDGAFARALDRDRACVDAAPHSRSATRAESRIAWLSARSEGDFGPLAALERVRRNPARADDPSAIAALYEQAAAFPPGRVRVEARMLVAEAWLGRLHRPDQALAPLRLVESDPEADPLTARLAEREIVGEALARGALDEAAHEARTHANRLDPRLVSRVSRLVRRRAFLYASAAELAVFVTLASAALIRAARRRALGAIASSLRGLGPMAAGFAAYVALVGGALASRYEAGSAAPFLWLGVVIAALVMGARAWSAAGAPHTAARVGRGLVSGASVLAAAFVLLDAVDPAYLDGFGL